MTKILFILKRRSQYGVSYGLKTSCAFVSKSLAKFGIESKIVEVTDNNCIDREVHQYKPTHVFIEAIWVVAEKFPVLFKLHPRVKWHVRLHSEVPFLGNEGNAMDWIKKYHNLSQYYPNFKLSSNSETLVSVLNKSLHIDVEYSPNIYEFVKRNYPFLWQRDKVDIGCFCANRPFKNQLNQALAAIEFAEENDMTLNFHINSSKFEAVNESTLKNLKAVFHCSPHKLVAHEWQSHENFLKLVRKMDIGLQVSYTESFNIVAADFVANHIPIVGSSEIEFLHPWYQADPNSVEDIKNKLSFAYYAKIFHIHRFNEWRLNAHNKRAVGAWLKLLGYNSCNNHHGQN